MSELTSWESFYVIVGAGAGALIGLQFIFVTLISNRPGLQLAEAGAAFATPTIVHFTVTLLVSSLIVAPWSDLSLLSPLWGLAGVGGLCYEWTVVRHIISQELYKPVIEDWLFHAAFPATAYLLLIVSAFTANGFSRPSLFAVGASMLVLLFTGIHNSWDAVTYHVFKQNAGDLDKTKKKSD